MNDDDFNALFTRWLNDDISQEELDLLKASPKYALYQKIANGSSELETPDFDKAGVLKRIHAVTGMNQQLTQPRQNLRKLWYAVAASVVLLLGLYFFLNKTTSLQTSYGEQTLAMLPNGSEVLLNGHSKVEYSAWNWDNNRVLNLEGTAYFKVTSGATFKVQTALGTVTVLGTEFTVNARNTIFEIQCFEGKVAVNTANNEQILTKQQGLRILENGTLETFSVDRSKPNWTNGESTFNNVPLRQVIAELESIYPITIETSKLDMAQRYSGGFVHENLELALQTVFVPLKLSYTITDNNTVILEYQ